MLPRTSVARNRQLYIIHMDVTSQPESNIEMTEPGSNTGLLLLPCRKKYGVRREEKEAGAVGNDHVT